MELGIDIDDVTLSLTEILIKQFNELYKEDVKMSDLTHYNCYPFTSDKNILDLISPRMLETRPFEKDAVDVINRLYEDYEITFVTAAPVNTLFYTDKRLQEVFPWYSEHNIIGMKNKKYFHGSILIDDNPKQLEGFHGEFVVKFLFDRPWNENIDTNKRGWFRFNNWLDIEKALKERDWVY